VGLAATWMKGSTSGTRRAACWCGCLCCSDHKLIEALRAAGGTEVGAVGLHLATRYELESFAASVRTEPGAL
jgi:hypothetical protein